MRVGDSYRAKPVATIIDAGLFPEIGAGSADVPRDGNRASRAIWVDVRGDPQPFCCPGSMRGQPLDLEVPVEAHHSDDRELDAPADPEVALAARHASALVALRAALELQVPAMVTGNGAVSWHKSNP